MLERILVPLDGSELSELALPYAQELAVRHGSEVTLLYVCPREEEEHLRVFQAYLETTSQRVSAAVRGVTGGEVPPAFHAIVASGPAAPTILDHADKAGVGLIVITSHGRSGVMPWALGGTASKVAHDLRVPVLLVRAAAGANIAARDRLFSRILLPLDGSEAGEAAVPYVVELATRTGMEVTLLQVLPAEQRVHTIGGLDRVTLPQEVLDRMKVDAGRYLTKVQDRFRGTKASVECEVRSGNPAQEILKLCDESNVRILAMSSHGHSGIEKWMLGSVSDKILHSARIPVLLARARPRR